MSRSTKDPIESLKALWINAADCWLVNLETGAMLHSCGKAQTDLFVGRRHVVTIPQPFEKIEAALRHRGLILDL